MVKFLLPSHLSALLPQDGTITRAPVTSVSLQPGSWEELVRQIRERFPQLAERALTESGSIASGFVLAVNDEVIRGGYASLEFRSGDEFSIIAAMAGG
jgi:sulfur carrier protein ThiS